MIPRQLGLYISISRAEDINTFSFYMAISNLCHEGVIHNYRKVILSLRTKIGISESLFRKLLAQCKKEGYLFEDEAKGLRIRSGKKILANEVKINPRSFENKKGKVLISRRKYCNTFKTYEEIKVWVKSLVLFNKSLQQNYAERVANLKNGNINSILIRAFQRKSFFISRKHIASISGYKSATSATYLIRKLTNMGVIIKDDKRVRYIKQITKYEYNTKYAHIGKYYYKSGGLYRNLINEIQINTESFLKNY